MPGSVTLKKTIQKWMMRNLAAVERTLRPRAGKGSDAPIKSFLFLQYAMPLGCCVHDTPIYEALKLCMPDATITVATRGAGYQALQHNPYVDHLLQTADPLTDTVQASRELKQQLRTRGIQPDCILTNSANQRTRVALLSMLLGTQLRVGFTLVPEFYDVPLQYDWSKSLIDNTLRLIEPAGCQPPHIEPRIFFTEKEVSNVKQLLQQNQLLDGKPLVVFVTQNSGGQRTGWHQDRFLQVINHVSETLGCHVVYVGTSADSAAIDTLRTAARIPGVSLAGKTTIPELSALLCMSDYAIALDTGTMHVGRAAGVPMVVMGPSWQRPLEWLPLGIENVRILRGEDIDYVPENYHLDEIEARQVIEAITELHALYPASLEQRKKRVARNLAANQTTEKHISATIV